MQKNKSGFSIIVGIFLMILLTLSAYVILSFIVPFMKNVKGIENTSNAYYQAYKGIEQSLYFTQQKRSSLTTETGAIVGTSVGYKANTYSSGNIIPTPEYGNSEYSTGFNMISINRPIQLEIGRKDHGIDDLGTKNIDFIFKVPSFSGSTQLTLSGSSPVIFWSLSSKNDTLLASGSYLTGTHINNSNNLTNPWSIRNQAGLTLGGTGETFQTFYQKNCNLSGSGCTLKMSVLNELILNSNNTIIPYLEYKIIFPGKVADRYTRIESYGKSYGFQKKLDIRVSQQTIGQSFDFTVFQ